jgi:serine protease Do
MDELRFALVTIAALACALLGCGARKGPAAPAPAAPSACATVMPHLASFGDVLETSSIDAKARLVTYAGLLELLLSFEGAAEDLDGELGALRSSSPELERRLKVARDALKASARFAHTERVAVEKHARDIAPLARETHEAWSALRAACSGKKVPPDCKGVQKALERFDTADTGAQHERAVADLVALELRSGALAKSRDRAVAASKAVQAAMRARAEASAPMPKRWASVQKDLAAALDGLVDVCKGEEAPPPPLVAAEHPDPRRLTVLLHVKPPAGVERSLLSLALSSTDEDERAFYRARAEGTFGSGFLLVKKTDKGNEVLVITNRHVVELGDRAALMLADGTSLGFADVVYASPTHDLAVLRPTGKVAIEEGFAVASSPAKDQQTVIATGFPGIIGRPSYQTTRGFVSTQSVQLDDGSSRPLTYVQHTAPIDPGSSGGPLTDEAGKVLGVNTLKVMGREAFGLAVPARYVLDTIRAASAVEARHVSEADRQRAARLACLGFLAELGSPEPRMLVLEQMISNHLVGVEGLNAAVALSEEEGFEQLWNVDSVRAMRIATLVKLRAQLAVGGGPSVLETCDEVDHASATHDEVKYRIRLAGFETRELVLRFEQGRWKIGRLSSGGPAARSPLAPKKLPPPGAPAGPRPPKKGVMPPKPKRT